MDIWKIAASVHQPRGDWCACGEQVSRCFMLTVILPARRSWAEQMYADLFGGAG